MTLRTMCGAVIAGILAGAVAHSDQTAAAVFLKGNEVYARAPGRSEPVQLTNDGRSKGLLVQSKDGTQIAFARDSVEPELADIVVMRVDGSDQREIHFRPAPNNIEGMRGVESLEWLSEGRLIAYGSLNPSTVEYAVLDVASGETVGGYLADGVTLVPSPDGSHVAYVGFVPHFTAPKDRRPRFCLDSALCVFRGM